MMKAIETRYKGHRFRSRTEARWAVLFDRLGVPYEYEPEGMEFDDGTRYLPDFWLPRERTYIEVKGSMPSDDEIHKCGLLAYAKRLIVNVLIGQPGQERVLEVKPLAPMPEDLAKWIDEIPAFEGLEYGEGRHLRERVPHDLRRIWDGTYHGMWHPAFSRPYVVRGGNEFVNARGDHRGVGPERKLLDYDERLDRLAVWTGAQHAGDRYQQWEDENGVIIRMPPDFAEWRLEALYPEDPLAGRRVLASEFGLDGGGYMRYPIRSDSILKAYDAARAARFEFGESGAG